MTESEEPYSDERFARQLLKDYLAAHGMPECPCEINENDPPDLIVTRENGERWGIEVTRTYHQVPLIGQSEIGSQQSVSAALWKFASKLEKKTESIRNLDYTIFLQGPGIFSSLKQWKKETEEAVVKHIRSGESKRLKFPGGTLIPKNPGKKWSPLIGGGMAEISSAIAIMLEHSLQEKTSGLSRWRNDFSQRWLLLLNCYVLASDIADIESTLRRLVCENTALAGFDGIFWSSLPDWTLTGISLNGNKEDAL